MSLSRKTRVTVHVAPNTVDAGQMIQISASVTTPFGAPVITSVLYMEIIDSKGRVYWPLSPIARNANGFSKLISTREMKSNTRYQVRVGINKSLSPQGWAFFKTSKKKLPLVIIPALILPTILIPKKALDPVWLIYRTELDAKVCPICKPHEGKKFRPKDSDIIRIGPPQLGGETHYGCRCHYDMELAVNPAQAKVESMLRAIKIITAVESVKHLEKEMVVT